jgi:hypothetical protein
MAAGVTDLRGDRVGQYSRDPRRAHQQRHVAVIGSERAQLAIDAGDLAVEVGLSDCLCEVVLLS